MKKINSNNYGGAVIGIGLIFAVIIPVIVKIIQKLCKNEIVEMVFQCSFFIGISLLVLFTVWLLVEGVQDKYWNQYYLNHKNDKLKLENGAYECQACGNRNIKEADKNCSICGIRFTDATHLKM